MVSDNMVNMNTASINTKSFYSSAEDKADAKEDVVSLLFLFALLIFYHFIFTVTFNAKEVQMW